jgi:hypothetical protein
MKITILKGAPLLTPPIALVFQKVNITPTNPSWLALIKTFTQLETITKGKTTSHDLLQHENSTT